MYWVIEVEIQFGAYEAEDADSARAFLKARLRELIDQKWIKHYHILSEPRKVDS